jgi:hypothetical protein
VSVSYFERLQNDVAGALLADADSYFADVTVVAVRSLEAVAVAAAAVAGTKVKNGKAGVAVRVLMPTMRKADKEVVGKLRASLTVRVVENPTVNNGSAGTGKSAEEVAAKCYDILDRLRLAWTANELRADENEVEPQVVDGTLQYDLAFYTYLPTAGRTVVATPTVTQGATTVTLACATASANVYYTSDGLTFPSAANAATLYSAPFAVPAAGTLLRVAAYKAGSRQSDVVNYTVT